MSKFIIKTEVQELSGIYKITSPTKKVYIGQTINMFDRIKTYERKHCKSQYKLYNSFVKHGVDKHTFEVLEYCDIELLNEKERYYQDLYSAIGKNGLNLMLTHTKDSSGKMSEEVKEKIRQTLTGTKRPQELKDKLRKANLGKKLSEEHKRKLSANPRTKEWNENISLALKGKKKSQEYIDKYLKNPERIAKIKESNRKRFVRVKCFDRYTDELIGEYESICEAVRQTGVHSKCIYRSLEGKYKYSKGKYFERYEH